MIVRMETVSGQRHGQNRKMYGQRESESMELGDVYINREDTLSVQWTVREIETLRNLIGLRNCWRSFVVLNRWIRFRI